MTAAHRRGFSDATALPSLASTDWRELDQVAGVVFDQALTALEADSAPSETYFGLSPAEAVKLYREKTALSGRTTRLRDIQKNLKDLSKEQLAALMHLENVRGMLTTSAHVMAERNQGNDNYDVETFERETRRARLADNLRLMKELGWGEEEVKFLLSNVKLWPTLTPHPTKDKNMQGAAYFAALTEMAEETAPEKRMARFEEIVNGMLRERLTPDAKDQYIDETHDALRQEAIYAKGMLDYLEDMQDGLDEVFGEGAIDLTAPDMHMDIAVRDWHTGDADGKPVPANVVFQKRILSAQMAIRRNIEVLEQSSDPRLAEIKKIFGEFEQRIGALAADMDAMLAVSSSSLEFQQYKERFVDAFRNSEYKGKRYEIGPALTGEIMKDLRDIAKDQSCDRETRRVARRVALRHRQNGMAMGKQELRHNGEDIDRIFNKLYSWLEEEKPEVLEGILDGVPIQDMNPATQTVFLRRLVEKHGKDIGDWLLKANPDGWNREILERFRLVSKAFNQNRMGAVIIAEAKPISVVQQQVLADAFGLKNLVHVALNESKETMEAAADNLADYHRHFGRESVVSRANGEHGDGAAAQRFVCVMMPQSDSQKQYGLMIRYTQREAKKRIVDLSLNNGHAMLEKTGTGLDSARGGMSPFGGPRGNLSALPDFSDFPPEKLKLLKQIVSYVSITHQGRDLGIRLGTKGQVYDMIGGVFEEISAACLAIDGKIPAAAVAPVETRYEGLVPHKLRQIAEEACAEYEQMRTRESRGKKTLGRKRIDLYLEEVSALAVGEMANVGARLDNRDDAKKVKKTEEFNQSVSKKRVTSLRAIGSAIAVANSNTYFDNSYTLGLYMQKIHQAYKAGELTRDDLKKIWNDPFLTQQILPNALVGLARANYEHGYDKITDDKSRWTVKRVMAAEENDWRQDGERMSDNLAFHTVLTLDALKAAAFLEALAVTAEDGAGTGFDASYEEIMGAVQKPNSALNEIKFGARTIKRFSYIEEIRAKARATRLTNAIKQETERRIDAGAISMTKDKSFLHHIACGARAAEGPANIEVLLDRQGYGARPDRKSALDLARKAALAAANDLDSGLSAQAACA